MTKQPKALVIAEFLEEKPQSQVFQQAAVAELRRLNEVNVELVFALDNLLKVNEGVGPTVYHAQDIARAALAKATGETS